MKTFVQKSTPAKVRNSQFEETVNGVVRGRLKAPDQVDKFVIKALTQSAKWAELKDEYIELAKEEEKTFRKTAKGNEENEEKGTLTANDQLAKRLTPFRNFARTLLLANAPAYRGFFKNPATSLETLREIVNTAGLILDKHKPFDKDDPNKDGVFFSEFEAELTQIYGAVRGNYTAEYKASKAERIKQNKSY